MSAEDEARDQRQRADAVAAWATAAGIGMVALMLVWLVGQRVSALLWTPPVGPTVAFLGALVAAAVTAVAAGGRLSRTQHE